MVSVADRGLGIDSIEQTLIFDNFYRGGHQRYTLTGAGISLAIAKAHGGSIAVVSQQAVLSRRLRIARMFSVNLPKKPSSRSERLTDLSPAHSARSAESPTLL